MSLVRCFLIKTLIGNFLFLCAFVQVVSESHLVSNFSHHYHGNGEDFLKNTLFQCTCEPYHESKLQNKTSLIFFEVYGRLANRMLGYALTLSLKREYGFRTFLRAHVLNSLQYYFENVDQVPPLEQLCHQEYPWIDYFFAPQILVRQEEYFKGKAIDYMNGARLMGNNINKVLHWDEIMMNHIDEIRRAFTFKKHFIDDADTILYSIKSDFLKGKSKKRAKKEFVFIGVHIRATDALRDMVLKYRMPEIKPSYYISAMHLAAEKFPKKKYNLIFVLVSDDLLAVEEALLPRVKNHLNVYPAGTGLPLDPHAIGVDLAILSRSNYTILSYGTFSFFGGFLAGGRRILPGQLLNRKSSDPHPFDQKLGPFVQSDEGLDYKTLVEENETGFNAGRSII